MKIRHATIAVAAMAVAALAAPTSAFATSDGPNATGLSSGGTKMVRFDTDKPKKAKRVGNITGLSGDSKLVGIDRRVQDRKLYGVGNSGGLYTLSTSTAKATKVGQLTIALDGTSFGVDFNPAANALRIISDTGQNLRQPFATAGAATIADTPLSYVAGTPATGVVGAAYTNNDLNADTATTLFDLDANLDQIAVQAPANAGSLSATGKLGLDAKAGVGFDIFSNLNKAGKTTSVTGYATLEANGRHGLYRVNLLTGDLTYEGWLRYSVEDLAVDLDR